MPRRSSSAAIARKSQARQLPQDRLDQHATLGGGGQQLRIAKLLALRLLGSECIPGTLRDQPTLLTSGGVWVARPGLLSYRQKSLNLPGDNSVYRTVCWMLRWPR